MNQHVTLTDKELRLMEWLPVNPRLNQQQCLNCGFKTCINCQGHQRECGKCGSMNIGVVPTCCPNFVHDLWEKIIKLIEEK